MATTAGEIIEAARDYSKLFTRQAAPDLPALLALSRIERQLAHAVLQEEPDLLAVWHEIGPLPADWEDGIVLPANQGVLGAEVRYTDGVQKGIWEVPILGPQQAYTQPHMYPSVSIMGGKLFLTDLRVWLGFQGLHGWEDLSKLRVRIIPELAKLTSLDQPITLPDSAEGALAANLALWMADRVGVALPALREAATASIQGWLMGMFGQNTRSWYVEVVR